MERFFAGVAVTVSHGRPAHRLTLTLGKRVTHRAPSATGQRPRRHANMSSHPDIEKASLAPTERLPGDYFGVDGGRHLHHYRPSRHSSRPTASRPPRRAKSRSKTSTSARPGRTTAYFGSSLSRRNCHPNHQYWLTYYYKYIKLCAQSRRRLVFSRGHRWWVEHKQSATDDARDAEVEQEHRDERAGEDTSERKH